MVITSPIGTCNRKSQLADKDMCTECAACYDVWYKSIVRMNIIWNYFCGKRELASNLD
jgi:NAD-dependent dihydropyrimidine dehydrogenase PreA subunit